MKRFENKVVLVTGGASGIGRACAERLAGEGAAIVIGDINTDAADRVAEAITRETGMDAVAFRFDARESADCQALVDQAVERFGRLDAVVNCAGVMDWHRAHEYPDDAWDFVLKINLYATFYVSRAAIPHLLKTKGTIVNMSSAASICGVPYAAAYSASKGGINAMTRSMAVEYADQGLRVNAVCPGGVDTPLVTETTLVPEWADMTKIARMSSKIGRMSSAAEVAASVAYLASDEAASVTGISLSIDGGQSAG
ncbi:SDR family oxidoreductase [Aureimonas sp. OT7]|uniref:SDR family NAD(P)-dependent oxidoreductase n=1 Tax=Aureimonas sp. OT7 TaxID=2816454 RepID=UPI00178464CC|nr:SDR family NAD(P)-dependent oxidoreductase [Aureimonas sp. OT7]QOG06565.1 SDR family oxidoreductase [Aureimonas sp. OT7]